MTIFINSYEEREIMNNHDRQRPKGARHVQKENE